MTLSKLASLSVHITTMAALTAACSSSTLAPQKHDSGSDTPVMSQFDSGHDAPVAVGNDAAGDGPTQDSGLDASQGQGGCSGHAPGPSDVPSSHRATAVACQPNAFVAYDGGSCTANSDCAASPNFPQSCLHGQCAPDECLTDADCGPNQVCACDPHVQAPAQQSNRCVPANCHVDSDCGAGGYCSPSFVACGYLAGYYCHRPTDPCLDATNCGCGQACQYTPAAGAFSCVAPGLCAG